MQCCELNAKRDKHKLYVHVDVNNGVGYVVTSLKKNNVYCEECGHIIPEEAGYVFDVLHKYKLSGKEKKFQRVDSDREKIILEGYHEIYELDDMLMQEGDDISYLILYLYKHYWAGVDYRHYNELIEFYLGKGWNDK